MGAPVKDRRCEASPLLGAMAEKTTRLQTKHVVVILSNIRLYYKLLTPRVYSATSHAL